MKTLTPTLHLATLFIIACCLPACGLGVHKSCDRDEDCDAEQTCIPDLYGGDGGGTCEALGDVGDECHFETDCQSDLVCLGRSIGEWEKISHGRCAPPADPGEPCVLDVDCRPRAPDSRFEGPAFCDENRATPVVIRQDHRTTLVAKIMGPPRTRRRQARWSCGAPFPSILNPERGRVAGCSKHQRAPRRAVRTA